MAYVSVYTDVEIDLRDIDTDDLESELERRGIEMGRADIEDVPRIFEALYVGNDLLALEIMRKFVQDATGRVLP